MIETDVSAVNTHKSAVKKRRIPRPISVTFQGSAIPKFTAFGCPKSAFLVNLVVAKFK